MGADDTAEQIATAEIRSPAEVARRALALFGVVGIAFGSPRNDVVAWLLENDLWRDLTPREQGFLDIPTPSKKAVTDASWYAERLIMLLWSLRLISEVPHADEQCDVGCFQKLLPPYADIEVADFILSASLRSDDELGRMADSCLKLHGEGRSAKLQNRKPRWPVDTEIIQERHHAINWVIGYDGLSWDEVTTDT
jgi:hypothetical protein